MRRLPAAKWQECPNPSNSDWGIETGHRTKWCSYQLYECPNPSNSDWGIETQYRALAITGAGGPNPSNSDWGIETMLLSSNAGQLHWRPNPSNSDWGIETPPSNAAHPHYQLSQSIEFRLGN